MLSYKISFVPAPNSSRYRVLKRDTDSSSSATSLTGRNTKRGNAPLVRWVIGSNVRMLSSSSPNKSRRKGSAVPGANTSTMPPRTAYSPASMTCSVR